MLRWRVRELGTYVQDGRVDQVNAKCLAVVVNVNASEKIMRHVAVGADGQDGRMVGQEGS